MKERYFDLMEKVLGAYTGKVGCNRNGHYKLYYASGKKNVSVQIEIEKQK